MDEFTYGYISGGIQTIIGHPFDTIKANYQSKIKVKYNLKHLYQGVCGPLLCNSIIISSQFGINQYLYKNYINNYFISGAISGSICSIILNPIELYKIRLQNSITNSNFMAKPMQGLTITMIRESISISCYFGIYHYLYDNNYCNSFISGGIAGLSSWVIPYNIDTIKTRIQSNKANTIIEAYKQGSLYKGIGVCSIRAILVNSIGFYSYQLIKDINTT